MFFASEQQLSIKHSVASLKGYHGGGSYRMALDDCICWSLCRCYRRPSTVAWIDSVEKKAIIIRETPRKELTHVRYVLVDRCFCVR